MRNLKTAAVTLAIGIILMDFAMLAALACTPIYLAHANGQTFGSRYGWSAFLVTAPVTAPIAR